MTSDLEKGDRIAKVMARAGLCSRRDAERWIADGRVSVNGSKLTSPAYNVAPQDLILVDEKPLPQKERTRLWLYHKPKGLVSSNKDAEGRPTVFANLPKDMPRVISIGRLDISTEGLLLLTNDGALARHLELPSTGWLRRYRVRAFGRITQADLDKLADGIAIDGILYGGIEAQLEREQGANVWLVLGLREGKNREVKKILEHLGLAVNRLIRISYGPFQLGDLATGSAREIKSRTLRDQLGEALVAEIGLSFHGPETDSEPADSAGQKRSSRAAPASGRKAGAPGKAGSGPRPQTRKPKPRDRQAEALERLTTTKPAKPAGKRPGAGKAGPNNSRGGKTAGGPRADRRR
uniref:pseudouridine synthase n=1 Tax=Pararhizobium sp. IMCC3301 TaxID=3067904 RepID=UPI002740CBBB|nr:pseudouridine synthase [Pararhizobium sp. IMCC3301]